MVSLQLDELLTCKAIAEDINSHNVLAFFLVHLSSKISLHIRYCVRKEMREVNHIIVMLESIRERQGEKSSDSIVEFLPKIFISDFINLELRIFLTPLVIIAI
jgi:hypothetical protein